MDPNKNYYKGLLAAAVGGAINGAAVVAATGFQLDLLHWKSVGAAAFVGGLINASMFLKDPRKSNHDQDLSGPQAPVPTTKPNEIKP